MYEVGMIQEDFDEQKILYLYSAFPGLQKLRADGKHPQCGSSAETVHQGKPSQQTLLSKRD